MAKKISELTAGIPSTTSVLPVVEGGETVKVTVQQVSDAIASDFDASGSAATVQGNLDVHVADAANPHVVTADQVGLGSVDNTADADKPVSTDTQTALDLKGDASDVALNTTHRGLTDNPHTVTATQVGPGNVDDTADADKPVSTDT
ncbi:MAG: hypothetical protein D4S01_11255 [Dehalococcoidia bacterium]|nr:MAG: hypothetical protein D4S01_11255 [Dehalococcoidia bacterium]